MTQVIPVVLALIGVTAVMVAAMVLLKKLTGRISVTAKDAGLKVITAVSIGQDRQLAAVRAGKKYLLIGVAQGGISLVCELSEEDMELIAPSEAAGGASSAKSFAEIFGKSFKKVGGEFIRPYPEEKKSDNSEE